MENQAVSIDWWKPRVPGGLVHYGEFAKMLGIDMDNPYFGAQVGKVLGRISEDAVAAGRPMISAIVVSKDTNPPGGGFFKPGRSCDERVRARMRWLSRFVRFGAFTNSGARRGHDGGGTLAGGPAAGRQPCSP